MAGLRDVRDRVAFVTGASSGIGAALARELAHRGAHVALVARRRDRLDALAGEIAGQGHQALVVPADVSNQEAIAGAVKTTLARWSRIDLLVNAAGFARHVLFKDHEVADMEALFQTNVLGCVYTINAVLPAMRARGPSVQIANTR